MKVTAATRVPLVSVAMAATLPIVTRDRFKAEVAHLLNQLTIGVCASAAVARRSY
ncbi:hypothetical protein [Bradyrhizobium sp.]|uniref:hypothetical protein n=1 Tax=Bradyrhizobium sp. TaxID=376 RepID=UPI003C1ABF9E